MEQKAASHSVRQVRPGGPRFSLLMFSYAGDEPGLAVSVAYDGVSLASTTPSIKDSIIPCSATITGTTMRSLDACLAVSKNTRAGCAGPRPPPLRLRSSTRRHQLSPSPPSPRPPMRDPWRVACSHDLSACSVIFRGKVARSTSYI
jgi:hypothetical protein